MGERLWPGERRNTKRSRSAQAGADHSETKASSGSGCDVVAQATERKRASVGSFGASGVSDGLTTVMGTGTLSSRSRPCTTSMSRRLELRRARGAIGVEDALGLARFG